MTGLAVLGQTIQVVDKSGKVVSTSRHLFDVFKIGRDAYNERKKEINAKKPAPSAADAPKARQRPTGRAYTIDDAGSVRSGRSHRSHHAHRSHHHERSRGAEATRSPPEGARSPQGPRSPGEDIPAGTPFYDAFPDMAPPPRRHSTFHPRPGPPPRAGSAPGNPHAGAPPQPQWFYGEAPNQPPQYTQPPFPGEMPPPPQPAPSRAPTTVVRRSTTKGKSNTARPRPDVRRRSSHSGIDMDLAYGPLPPDLTYPGSPSVASTPAQDEDMLKGLIGKANFLLDEAQCLRHSATTTIAHLQKSPDAMAAVGLTLAEISALAKKMGPKVLTNLKTISPAVFALLSHPHFLVAVGVATGVTIVAFGGYKIVKRIQERSAMQAVGDEGMLPVEDVSRIETWRRGIAEVEANSDGTSVDGEFMTPMARNLSRLNLAEEKRDRERNAGREKSAKSKGGDTKSVVSSRSKRSSSEPAKPRKTSASTVKSSATKTKSSRSDAYVSGKKVKAKEPKPSPLRRLLLA